MSLLESYNESRTDKIEVNPTPIVLKPGGNQEFEVECIIGYQYAGCNRAL